MCSHPGDAPTAAAITIGQSPRPDIMNEVRPLLGPGVRVIEAGVLDGLSDAEIAAMFPADHDHTLVTRLRDGREVLVGRGPVLERVQACVDRVERDAEAELIMMLCTGSFPAFHTGRLILYPEHLLFQTVRAVAQDTHVAVLTPSARQVDEQVRRWRAIVPAVTVRPFSPYTASDDLDAACQAFVDAGVGIVVLDCLGYTTALKRQVRERTGRPVLLARTVLARAAAELIGDA